jgi:hypothetical protein
MHMLGVVFLLGIATLMVRRASSLRRAGRAEMARTGLLWAAGLGLRAVGDVCRLFGRLGLSDLVKYSGAVLLAIAGVRILTEPRRTPPTPRDRDS